jgi:carbon monoxide dehydrogenase subunit G
MEFDNSFEVPLPADETWKLLMDIRRIAPCLPGAELTDVVDDRTYKGKVGVRLGPVSLAFAGTVKFDEIDDAAHRAKISAQGSDAKGRGAANATATFHLEEVAGGTRVLVHTNLTLSGAVAQYGRGVGIIQMTAAQIITQFANNLKAQFAPAAAQASAAPATAASSAGPAPAPVAASGASAAPANPAAAASSPPPAAAKPISGFALAGAVLLAWLKRLFGRG